MAVKKVADAKKVRAHPPYAEMVKEAIVALKERTGSSQIAIAKYIEETHKKENLSENYKKLILSALKKLVASGNLVKVKHSFKLNKEAEKPKKAAKKADAEKPKKAGSKVAKVGTPVKGKKAVGKKAGEKKVGKKVTPNKAKKAKATPVKVKKLKSIKSPVKKATGARSVKK